jgi:hypothetical protein
MNITDLTGMYVVMIWNWFEIIIDRYLLLQWYYVFVVYNNNSTEEVIESGEQITDQLPIQESTGN